MSLRFLYINPFAIGPAGNGYSETLRLPLVIGTRILCIADWAFHAEVQNDYRCLLWHRQGPSHSVTSFTRSLTGMFVLVSSCNSILGVQEGFVLVVLS